MGENHTEEARSLADTIVEALQDKKGRDIMVMDLRKSKGASSDYFVIATGTSDTHVKALADAVEEAVQKKLAEKPHNKEGKQQAEWILLNYVNVVTHIFQKEKRNFYNLEELWGDAKIQTFAEA